MKGLKRVFGVCENGHQRDAAFLHRMLDHDVDLRLSPMEGPTLTDDSAELLRRQIQSARKSKAPVHAILVHADADRFGLDKRIGEAERWFQKHGFKREGLRLVVCVPVPCTEAWLCKALGLGPSRNKRNATTSCDPWKISWSAQTEPDPICVGRAAKVAVRQLSSCEDFRRFAASWVRCGLPKLKGR